MKEVSLSIDRLQNALGDIEALDMAKAIGLTCVDFCLLQYDCANPYSVYNKSEDEICEHFTKIKKHADSIGIRIGQTHGRIKAYRYDEEHNKNELASFERDCLATSLLGSKYCVVHAVHLGLDAPAEDQRKYNSRMFSEYMPYARKYNITVASETLGDTRTPDGRDGVDFFGDLDEFLTHYDELASVKDNDGHICTCIDTGHTNKASRFEGKVSVPQFIRRAGHTIGCLHLNDNDSLTDQHKVPLSGNLDWNEVLSALRDVGYEGTYNMELNLYHFGKSVSMMRDYAEFSVKVMRNLLDEFYE